MASNKQSASVARTAAWDNGERSYGARFVKEGFAFTRAQDLAFACGAPRIRLLVDGHPLDADATGSALAGKWSEVVAVGAPWPRALAARFVRMEAVAGYVWRQPIEITDAGRTGAENATPIDAAEARALASVFMEAPRFHYAVEDFALLLEAFVGPDAAFDAIVDALERLGGGEWKNGNDTRLQIVSALGWIHLRTSGDRRPRLQALFERWGAPEPLGERQRATGHHALDRILHGRAGVERSGARRDGKFFPSELAFVHDDPAFVLAVVEAFGKPDKYTVPDVRNAFLGGEPVIALEGARWKSYVANGGAPFVLRTFEDVRSPSVVAMVKEMAEASRAKTAARAWLDAHADYVAEVARGSQATSKPAPTVDDANPLRSVCERIERWFAENTKLSPAFRHPASEGAIAEAERVIGAKLPESYRAFLRLHDGQDEGDVELQIIPGVSRLAAIEAVVAQWKDERESDDDSGEFDAFQERDRMRSVLRHAGRIPIAGSTFWDGDNTYLDLVPGPKGTVGQVITMTTECDFVVLAPSFGELLERVATLLESGALAWDEDEQQLVPAVKGRKKAWSGHPAEWLAKRLDKAK